MVRVGPQCIPHAPSRTADAPLNTLSSFDHVTHTHSHVVAQHIHQQHLHAARMDCDLRCMAFALLGPFLVRVVLQVQCRIMCGAIADTIGYPIDVIN